MASAKTRRTARRRDRRKAKQTGYRRPGKSKMSGNIVGHGGAGMKTGKKRRNRVKPTPGPGQPEKKYGGTGSVTSFQDSLRVSLGEMAKKLNS